MYKEKGKHGLLKKKKIKCHKSLLKASDLLDKDFKRTIINVLKQLKETWTDIKENRKMIYGQNENTNKEKKLQKGTKQKFWN